MAGLINELIEVLGEECENFENLLGLSYEKNQVIVKNDIESLQKITKLENILVGNNQKLERRRERIIKDMATVLGKKDGELTITMLWEMLKGQKEHQALVEVSKKLLDIVEQLKITNETNKTLVEMSLNHVEFNMNLLRNTSRDDNQNTSMFQAQQ